MMQWLKLIGTEKSLRTLCKTGFEKLNDVLQKLVKSKLMYRSIKFHFAKINHLALASSESEEKLVDATQ